MLGVRYLKNENTKSEYVRVSKKNFMSFEKFSWSFERLDQLNQ